MSRNKPCSTLPNTLERFFVKVSRLYQPGNPLFWIMVVLNALSAILGWLVHAYPLVAAAGLLVASSALGNAILGTWLTWCLVNS